MAAQHTGRIHRQGSIQLHSRNSRRPAVIALDLTLWIRSVCRESSPDLTACEADCRHLIDCRWGGFRRLVCMYVRTSSTVSGVVSKIGAGAQSLAAGRGRCTLRSTVLYEMPPTMWSYPVRWSSRQLLIMRRKIDCAVDKRLRMYGQYRTGTVLYMCRICTGCDPIKPECNPEGKAPKRRPKQHSEARETQSGPPGADPGGRPFSKPAELLSLSSSKGFPSPSRPLSSFFPVASYSKCSATQEPG